MKRSAALILILISFSILTPAQDDSLRRNNVYLEVLGTGVIYSLNYERDFNTWSGIRTGFSYFSLPGGVSNSGAHTDIFFIPILMGNFMFKFSGTGNALELGAGYAYGPALSIGYRYSPLNGGFLFRITYTPIFFTSNTRTWGGISFGYIW
jgi:hypothetical protein